MKKLLLLSLLTIATIAFSSQKSQAQEYEQGSKVINAGIGFGGGFGLPISISMDYGWKEKISIGGVLAYAGKTTSVAGAPPIIPAYDIKYSYIMVGARGAYHFTDLMDKLDPYVGVVLGYNVASVKLDPAPAGIAVPTAGGLITGGFAGARYGFTDNIGGFAEVGYGIGSITLGVSYKF